MICEIICVDGFLYMSHLDIVHMLFAYLHVIRILSEHMHIIRTLSAMVLDMFLFNRQCWCHPYIISSTLYISYHVQLIFHTLSTQNAHCQCYLDVVCICTSHRETWLVDDICHPHVHIIERLGWLMTYVIHMSSEGGYIIHTLFVILFIYPIICNSVSTHSLYKCTLSMPCRCCPHMYTWYTDLVGEGHMSSICHPHVVCRFIGHPHIIWSTPHGHHSSKLSFHCDRNWLLNRICHKNVELFHFRII